ncbi:MAG: 30S ribosomal protein S13 [Nanoarchaeota archaeon]|nr:30S ribosomal protein S13 [Nanoarchaeota archaeon]
MANKKIKAKPSKIASKKPEFKQIIRIAEADLDGNKKIEHALISIKGVSWTYAHAIRKALGFDNVKLSDLSQEDIEKLKQALAEPRKFGIPSWLYNRQKDIAIGKDMHLLSNDLILAGKMDIRRLKSIRCYRGVRHFYNYKVRGQRTRSRGANVRGRTGATVGVVRKKLKK